MLKKLKKIISIIITTTFLLCIVSNIKVIAANNAIGSSSKKGALLTYSADDILDLGCKQVAINYTLGSYSGHLEMAKQLHKKGVKITLIVTSNIALNEDTISSNPEPYNNPILYMPDLTNANVKMTFDDMLREWGGIVDNYVIGNEISDQIYCYYKPCYVEEYVEAYCKSFRQAYNAIKSRKSSAKVFIPFDQSWNMPALSKSSGRYDANLSRYKYNTKEMLQLIRKNLDASIDWGVAAHPYPDPLTSAVFWDDQYATNTDDTMVVTMNNIEVMCNFLSQPEMRRTNGSGREILISEIGFSDSDGDDVAAGALMYAWTKIENNNQIIGFLYNSNDFPLYGKVEDVFKTMDKINRDEVMELMNKVINSATNNYDSEYDDSSSYTNTTDPNLDESLINVFGGRGKKMVSQKIHTDEDGEKSRIIIFDDGSDDWYGLDDAYMVAEKVESDGFTYRAYSDGKINQIYTYQIDEVKKMIKEKRNVCGGWRSTINEDGTRTFHELKYKPTGEWIKIPEGELVIGPHDNIQYQANMYLIKKFSSQ